MGSAFQLYGIVLLLMGRYGAGWLARRNQSQEYLDSWMVLTWGVVNTFSKRIGTARPTFDGPYSNARLPALARGLEYEGFVRLPSQDAYPSDIFQSTHCCTRPVRAGGYH
jgi:hypothetical protein